MAAKYAIDPALTTFVESLMRPSVVLILLDEKATQTGFFISRRGLVCTCYHGFHLLPQAIPSVRWQGRTYQAAIVYSSKEEDLVILTVQNLAATDDPQPLPISAEEIPTSEHRHAALSLGFGGVETYGIREAARVFTGDLSVRYDTEHQQRVEFSLIGASKGHSGAPVMDVQRFRVVGYVRASYASNSMLNGDALTFKSALAVFPDLKRDWDQAGREFDLKLAAYYRQSPFPLDLTHCPDNFVARMVAAQVADDFQGHRDRELFELNRYVPRAIEKSIIDFSKESTNNLLILSGASGSGKTSLLLALTRQLDDESHLPVLIKCNGLRIQELPQVAFNKLLPGEAYELRRLGQLFARGSGKQWVLFLDGLNECADFSLLEFRETVEALRTLSELPDVRLKVIFSLRTEFLREHLQDFFFWQGVSQDNPDADLLHFFERDERGQPYLNLGSINATHLPNGKLELEEMYERYSRTGLKPATTFEQLSPPILEMLDRPFVLDLMMRIYQGVEIPLGMGRSSLIREIVARTLKKAGIRSVRANQMAIYLSELAMYILRSSADRECLDSDLYRQNWHKGDDLEVLLDTPFLERETIRRSFGEENIIRFSADWSFEFFIARYLWQWWRYHADKDVSELLSELHVLLPFETETVNLQHLFIALVFFSEWSVTDDPSRFSFLVKVMNDSARPALARGFTRECLDFFRITYGLATEIPASDGRSRTTFLEIISRNAEHFGKTAGEGLLDYVDYLGIIGENKDAQTLLNLDVVRQAIAGDAKLEARRFISLALTALANHDIEGALNYANRVDPQKLPSGLLAKRAFVVGRAYQFKSDFVRAEEAYEVGRRASSVYAYKCEHQLLAFIPIIARSDFASVVTQLNRMLEDKSFELTREQRLASILLRATCLFRLGRYGEAEAQLNELFRLRMVQRHKQGIGLALRASAELYFMKFEHQLALDTIERSIETLQGISDLSLATAYDTKALIVGLLTGDREQALEYSLKSLELSKQAQHGANVRWFLQTSAKLSALAGDTGLTNQLLERAGAANPFEHLRRDFIRVLARHCAGDNGGDEFKAEIHRLQDGFRGLQLDWYPGVLSLVASAVSRVAPDAQMVATLFAEGTNVEGLLSSYLYARIFAAQ